MVQASQRHGRITQRTTGQSSHLQGVHARPIVRRRRGGRSYNRPVSQVLMHNNGWQIGDNNAPNVPWPQAIPNNEMNPNSDDPGNPRMCHNGGFCPNGNPCPGNPTAAVAYGGQNQGPMDNEDPQANGFDGPAQQLETPEDAHIRNILEHTRMHRDGILRRLNDNSDVNRYITDFNKRLSCKIYTCIGSVTQATLNGSEKTSTV